MEFICCVGCDKNGHRLRPYSSRDYNRSRLWTFFPSRSLEDYLWLPWLRAMIIFPDNAMTAGAGDIMTIFLALSFFHFVFFVDFSLRGLFLQACIHNGQATPPEESPDRSFHKNEASESVLRRSWTTQNPPISWFWGFAVVKGPVGHCWCYKLLHCSIQQNLVSQPEF